jgi:hypothetical protein
MASRLMNQSSNGKSSNEPKPTYIHIFWYGDFVSHIRERQSGVSEACLKPRSIPDF